MKAYKCDACGEYHDGRYPVKVIQYDNDRNTEHHWCLDCYTEAWETLQ